MKSHLIVVLVCLIMLACTPKKENEPVSKYPLTKKVDTVDTYFGETVSDPYRWLENDTTKETAGWVTAQNDLTFDYLNTIKYRDKVKKRIEHLNNYEKLSAPFKEGEFFLLL